MYSKTTADQRLGRSECWPQTCLKPVFHRLQFSKCWLRRLSWQVFAGALPLATSLPTISPMHQVN